jgi:P27 family predicted phage terminase small subunit
LAAVINNPTWQKRVARSGERDGAPEATPVVIAAPAHLSAYEQEVWKEIADYVGASMKITSREDALILETLVTTTARERRANAWLRKKAETCQPGEEFWYEEVDEKTGRTMKKPEPAYTTAKDCAAILLKLWGHFGLTPSTRSKVKQLGLETKHNPDDEFGAA